MNLLKIKKSNRIIAHFAFCTEDDKQFFLEEGQYQILKRCDDGSYRISYGVGYYVDVDSRELLLNSDIVEEVILS